MASLVHTITAITDARYGVNILDSTQPGQVQGESTNVVGSVAVLPWGPVDTVTSISGPGELFDIFSPGVFASVVPHPALLAYINKTFPATMKIVRVAATGQAAAAFTFNDDDPAPSVIVTAAHPGTLGNQISVSWGVNADNAASRDMTVSIGTAYSATYLAVATAAPVALTDPGDPYATATAHGAMDEVPAAIAPTLLVGGLDGTAVAADYLGAAGSGRGLEEYADMNVDVDVLFGAEIPQALVGVWNTGLKLFQDTYARGMAILSTDDTIVTAAAAIADVASYRGDRHMQPWPKVTTVNTFDADRALATVDGNSFMAVAVASVIPEASPGGASGAPFLKGIAGLAVSGVLTTNVYKSLNDAGIAPWFNSTASEGFIIHRGVTTSLAAGKTKTFRRRMTDFILESIGVHAELFVGTILDLDLPNKGLGNNTANEIALWSGFLEDLKTNTRIQSYEIDPFSANVQANLDAGQWIVAVQVKLYGVQEEIVLLANIGEGVTITTA